MSSFQTWSGSCQITNNEVQLKRNHAIGLIRLFTHHRRLAGLLAIGITLIAIAFWFGSDAPAIPTIVAILKFTLLPVAIAWIGSRAVVYLVIKSQEKRSATPDRIVFRGSIPRENITSIDSVRRARLSAFRIDFTQDTAQKRAIMIFWEDTQFDQAKKTLQSAGFTIS